MECKMLKKKTLSGSSCKVEFWPITQIVREHVKGEVQYPSERREKWSHTALQTVHVLQKIGWEMLQYPLTIQM